MSQHSDSPPNPREAKYRRTATVWTEIPFTVFLIAVSLIVAGLSKLGEDTSRVGFLYFAEPLQENQEVELFHKMILERAGKIQQEMASKDPEEIAIAILEGPDASALARGFLRYASFTNIKKGQLWRLFTPMFLHFGLMHIVFNMMWLWQLGQVLETGMRTGRFCLLVLFIALVSNATQAWVSGPSFGGMSGVVYGLFGYMVVRAKFHPAGGPTLNRQAITMMLLWLALGFTGTIGPIANGAHLAGLLSGAAAGWLSAMRGGGWHHLQRRREFHHAVSSHAADSLHQCAVCGKTERDDPSLDFRISGDGEEYCEHHLPR